MVYLKTENRISVFSSDEIIATTILKTSYGYEVSIRLSTGIKEVLVAELQDESLAKDILSKIVYSMRNPSSAGCDVKIEDGPTGVKLVDEIYHPW